MASVARGKISYSVGSESNPGDPFGRSELAIEVDGRARLDQHTRAGKSAWTGTVAASALERLWGALEQTTFPSMADVPRPPPGSAIRALTVGDGRDAARIYIPWHARVPGYGSVFTLLDSLIRQLSEDTVKAVPAMAEKLVDGVTRTP